MITEEFRYARLSALVAGAVVLEPDLTCNPTFFQCDLADPAIIVESLYRIYRIAKIHAGRQALATPKFRDPIITVDEGRVKFEAFSLDMTRYASIAFNEHAFNNVKVWNRGQTNIDISPAFITALRSTELGRVNSIRVDPDAFTVHADDADLVEKKVELPKNWTIALDNLRGFTTPSGDSLPIKDPASVVNMTPFNAFVGPFATVEEAWQPREGWQFARLSLRSGLGEACVGTTVNLTERFDGRQNPRYEAIRDLGMLRLLKSFILVVDRVHGDVWQVTGGGRTHVVQKRGASYTCDCKDTRYGPTTCKHVRAVTKPKSRVIKQSSNTWRLITQDGRELATDVVNFTGQRFTCTCKEFAKTNICQHVVEVLEAEEDFQFKELVEDLT